MVTRGGIIVNLPELTLIAAVRLFIFIIMVLCKIMTSG